MNEPRAIPLRPRDRLFALTSGYRDPLVQQRLFDEEVRHRGARHNLYRTHDDEWWHFEYRPSPRTQETRRAR